MATKIRKYGSGKFYRAVVDKRTILSPKTFISWKHSTKIRANAKFNLLILTQATG